MSNNTDILCSRCKTPFPKERGKAAVTCATCGQLRPDLDMTLDDDDDDLTGAFSAAAGTSGPTAASPPATSPMPAADPSSEEDVPFLMRPSAAMNIQTPEAEPSDQTPRSSGRNYVAMTEMSQFDSQAPREHDSLIERVSPVNVILAPLIAGTVCGLTMLNRAPDFSSGSWYATAAVFAMMFVAALFAGLVAAGLLHMVRLRVNFILRLIFLLTVAAVCYYGLQEVPRRVQIRPNDLPAFVFQ